ncbi:hypothetical protein EHW97_01425 [Aeromicrobium camelliae]|uniref:Pilus assembly protein n=1 Tax=Aeromicrobium camelliae TaxID=1538144 RepID=A0A3N6WRU7_9ACTN|nr:hypothetical protein [Aeromicrobium camelliae]RQN10176.1 hypothetical protein EHW97_01425 [Aeromicrobium camelliae]
MKERGSATIEFTWLTLLLLVPFVYALLAVFETQRAAYAVNAASAAAGRAFHQAADAQSAEARARHAARITLQDFDVHDVRIDVRCHPACFQPGSSVEVLVATRQPLPLVPDAWGTSLAAIEVEAQHSEPYGTYRAQR